jgi:hypothetical protein
MAEIKIGIVGSRKFGDLCRVTKLVEFLHDRYGDDLVIVSGGARGVDTAAETAARERMIRIKIFRPKPDKPFWKAAMERNTEIVEYSDQIYAFWSCKPDSTGTVDSMHKALIAGKLVGIYTPKGVFFNSYREA